MNIARESTQNLKLARSYFEALSQMPLEAGTNPKGSRKKETRYNEMLDLAYKHLDKALKQPGRHLIR